MATIADYAICTKQADCKTTTSCCAAFTAAAGKANASGVTSPLVCIPLNTKKDAVMTIPAVASKIADGSQTTGGKGYATAECVAKAAGASTLAVSAVAAATAVYMM